MNYQLPEKIQTIIKKFEQSDHQIYLVGGVVRDLLLQRDHQDWDLTTSATPEQMLTLLQDLSGFEGEPFYNNQFGTVGLPFEDGVIQITTMRKEGVYKDSRHPEEVFWTEKIEEDLARRDFTVNAMALNKDILIDPFAGQDDLEHKVIKAVGDPNKRFEEDALRLLRAVRFASQLGFMIESSTWQAIIQNKQLLEHISWERIRDELLKILVSEFAVEGMTLLRTSGLLEIILPEVTACFGVAQDGENHDRKYDVGDHLIQTMKYTPSNDPIVKLAALLHDIGKPKTFKVRDGNPTFYHHEIEGAKMSSKIAERLRLSKKDSQRLETLVRFHMFSVDEKQTDSALRRFIKNVGKENLEAMMAIREGDRLGGGTATATSWRLEQFKERIAQLLIKPFTVADLAIDGHDVMAELSLPAGRKIGELLNQLFEEVVEDASKNNREYLLKRLTEIS